MILYDKTKKSLDPLISKLWSKQKPGSTMNLDTMHLDRADELEHDQMIAYIRNEPLNDFGRHEIVSGRFHK